MQTEMTLLGNVGGQRTVSNDLVAHCNTEQEAFRLCVRHSRHYMPHESIAEHLDISTGAFSRMLTADKAKQELKMSRVQQIKLQQVCQNKVIDQWADLYDKGMLNCQRAVEDEEADLLAKLDALRARKSA